MIALRKMCADAQKKQIPPLRYAPVGMTIYVNLFKVQRQMLAGNSLKRRAGRGVQLTLHATREKCLSSGQDCMLHRFSH
jgi:hypothetical protein